MMSRYLAIDDLLATRRPLPAPAERSRLRASLDLTADAVAHAVGVSPATLHAWEEGHAEPQGAARDAYAYFLSRACTCAAAEPHPANQPAADTSTEFSAPQASCVLCGSPATQQVDGYPQHLTAAECAEAATTAPAHSPPRSDATPERLIAHSSSGASQHSSTRQDPIGETVAAALAVHDGDQRRAIAALTARAIPDALRLLEACRVGARYDIVRHPALPEILRKLSPHAPDRIWEARPEWQRPQAPEQKDPVAALDVSGAYLAALKTHLPLGQLQPADPYPHDRRRAGLHLITPSAWEHGTYLPNPLGPRLEPGPVWITEPTLRLLLRLSSSRHALCDPPVIHESYTSGSTENLLEKFRTTLRDARARALGDGDTVTLEYVKALYVKFVSALGVSAFNRGLRRPDWMHIIHSQAFANLWSKAYNAHTEGLTLVRVCGTAELHLQGEWRRAFREGRDLGQVKLKDTYEVIALYPGAAPEPQESCNEPYIEKRRYEYAGGRYVGCRSCGGDLCTSCRTTHLAPSDIPYEDNDDNVCPACR
ncbi:transcriptional regulator [Streptomyces sp. NRRL S-1521]|uniref:helix-turn-helix domain-containing protein n=1 Tax=Streptomyces sp. NRRL S-1521 TaxID=1609100 RepID=UPI000AC6A074|nr:transcriptional regulator [Streptomyces sp. NRRL S-1521]